MLDYLARSATSQVAETRLKLVHGTMSPSRDLDRIATNDLCGSSTLPGDST